MTTNLMSKPATEVVVFKPSIYQEKWLDTALQLMSDNITEIAETCRIDRTTWYKWLKDDNFRAWFKQEWDKRLSGEGFKLDVIGMKKAKTDHKYWQDMQRRVGNLKSDQDAMGMAFKDGEKELRVIVTRGDE